MAYHPAMRSKDASTREAWRCVTRLFLSDEAHDRFHEACAEIGLPHPGSLRALLSISSDPPSMRDLADAMHCDASYITCLVDALEGLGYVERRVMPTDRRVKQVQLTAEGDAARRRALEVLLAPPDSLEQLTATEARTLAELLAKVTASYPPLP